MEKQEKQLVRDGKLDEYNEEIDDLVERLLSPISVQREF
jgi:hypothetical protein